MGIWDITSTLGNDDGADFVDSMTDNKTPDIDIVSALGDYYSFVKSANKSESSKRYVWFALAAIESLIAIFGYPSDTFIETYGKESTEKLIKINHDKLGDMRELLPIAIETMKLIKEDKYFSSMGENKGDWDKIIDSLFEKLLKIKKNRGQV